MNALRLVSIACKSTVVTAPHMDVELSEGEMTHIEILQRRIYSEIGQYGPSYDTSGAPLHRRELLYYLYQIAALVYLNRAVLNVSDVSFQHRRLVREGMLILRMLGSCESAWPLFILACEATGDEQRLEVLEVFQRTLEDQDRRSNHIYTIQAMVTAVWNQNDLGVDNEVDYSTTLDAVISTMPFLPLFA